MKKKAFTLIELIAVLVILAILALIVTPLVMNIIRKARVAADKRSIDAYGRSVELAIATYLLDNGNFPADISQLTIEYIGDQVECSTTQLNSDSSVYLAGCIVGGRSVDYTYGKEEVYTSYSVGDEVTYNNIDYYVIADSGEDKDTVILLKKTPLTTSEVNQYGGVGTENNHVNMYATTVPVNYYQQASDNNSYGRMQYYSSDTCNGYGDISGCTVLYNDSEIKYVVDAWAKDNVQNGLQEARLITIDDLINNLSMEFNQSNPSNLTVIQTVNTPDWIFNDNWWYWTATPNTDKNNELWMIRSGGYIHSDPPSDFGFGAVRPVITIKKSALN